MATLSIHDLPEHVVTSLEARAAASRLSLSEYVVEQLRRIASHPTRDEIAARLASMDRADGPSRDGILQARDEARR